MNMNRRNNDLDDFDDLLDEIGAGGEITKQ